MPTFSRDSYLTFIFIAQAIKEYAEAAKKKPVAKEEVADSGLTEEEERELAELMSDSE